MTSGPSPERFHVELMQPAWRPEGFAAPGGSPLTANGSERPLRTVASSRSWAQRPLYSPARPGRHSASCRRDWMSSLR